MPPVPKLLGKDEYPEFQYKPAHQFMRCHSHNDDPADGETKVGQLFTCADIIYFTALFLNSNAPIFRITVQQSVSVTKDT